MTASILVPTYSPCPRQFTKIQQTKTSPHQSLHTFTTKHTHSCALRDRPQLLQFIQNKSHQVSHHSSKADVCDAEIVHFAEDINRHLLRKPTVYEIGTSVLPPSTKPTTIRDTCCHACIILDASTVPGRARRVLDTSHV